MVDRAISWRFDSPYILRLPINSAIVEGVVSVTFDLILIGITETLCQAVSSNYNLRIVYDFRRALSLRSRRVFLLGTGTVGHRWLSRTLSIVLSVCALSVIILGFAINGHEEVKTVDERYKTYCSIPFPPNPVEFDYDAEYKVAVNQTRHQPNLLSQRIIAIDLMSHCLNCNYSTCEYLAYAFKNDRLEATTLVEGDEARRNLFGECISRRTFRRDVVARHYNRGVNLPLSCDVSEVRVSFEEGESFAKAKIVSSDCDIDVQMMMCFRRVGHDTHCAGFGRMQNEPPDSHRLGVILVHNVGKVLKKEVQLHPYEMSVYRLTDKQHEVYIKDVAYLASLEFADLWKLDLLPFVHVEYDVMLPVKTSENINVSDIDLRIAVPCAVITTFLVIFLSMVAFTTWFSSVHSKRRKYFNSFSSVPEILELLVEESIEVNRCTRNPIMTPSIGIRNDTALIGVQSPEEDFIGGAPWPESEVL